MNFFTETSAKYRRSIFCTICIYYLSLLAISCGSGMIGLYETNQNRSSAPVPGDGGTLFAVTILENSIELLWTKATDETTTQGSLEYKIVRSETPTINTVETADAAPDIVLDWTTDIDTTTANSLSLDTVYYFNVIVRNDENNMVVYSMMSQKTLADMDAYYAFYRFNDLTDSSGNGYMLTNNGAALTQNRELANNSAYDYNFDYLESTNNNDFNFTTELTISAWVCSENASLSQKVIGKVNSTINQGYLIGINGGHLAIETWDSTNYHIIFQDGSQLLSNNTWHHIAITWKSGGYLRSYIDGVLDKEIAISGNSLGSVTDRPLTIGISPWDPRFFQFYGSIDDIRIYGKEMQDFEIDYLAGLPAD